MNQTLRSMKKARGGNNLSSSLPSKDRVLCIALIDENALSRECFARAAFTRQSALVILPFSSVDEFIEHHDIFDLVVYVDYGKHGEKFRKILATRDYLASSRVLVLSYRATGHLILRPFRPRARLITIIQASEKSLQEILSALVYISFERRKTALSTPYREEKLLERRGLSANSGEVKLTNRQRQVLDLVSRGHNNQRISEIFGISVNTVKVYVYQIMKKTGSANRVQLILFARHPHQFDAAPTSTSELSIPSESVTLGEAMSSSVFENTQSFHR